MNYLIQRTIKIVTSSEGKDKERKEKLQGNDADHAVVLLYIYITFSPRQASQDPTIHAEPEPRGRRREKRD